MRNKSFYESGKRQFLLVTERALYFNIIRLRYVRNLVFYSLPECPRVFEDLVSLKTEKGAATMLKIRLNQRKKRAERTGEVQDQPSEAEEKKLIVGESVMFGLFSIYDSLKLERLVGSDSYKSIIDNKTKETFQFM